MGKADLRMPAATLGLKRPSKGGQETETKLVASFVPGRDAGRRRAWVSDTPHTCLYLTTTVTKAVFVALA